MAKIIVTKLLYFQIICNLREQLIGELQQMRLSRNSCGEYDLELLRWSLPQSRSSCDQCDRVFQTSCRKVADSQCTISATDSDPYVEHCPLASERYVTSASIAA
jgi:hypothetical protein